MSDTETARIFLIGSRPGMHRAAVAKYLTEDLGRSAEVAASLMSRLGSEDGVSVAVPTDQVEETRRVLDNLGVLTSVE